ncbi:hypothetical protein EDD16DRAFT_685752 [Pisolithus croceorrhizus]|nr:hypothetical protein EDD16DRAFT_685752 [Pisolithus croceorrhizus]
MSLLMRCIVLGMFLFQARSRFIALLMTSYFPTTLWVSWWLRLTFPLAFLARRSYWRHRTLWLCLVIPHWRHTSLPSLTVYLPLYAFSVAVSDYVRDSKKMSMVQCVFEGSHTRWSRTPSPAVNSCVHFFGLMNGGGSEWRHVYYAGEHCS